VQNCLRFQNQRALGNATGTLAYGNLCRLGSASGISYAVEFEDGGLTDLTIYNNTFAGGWNWRMHFTTEGNPVRGLAVYNNAFRGMTGLNVDTEGGSNVSTNAWTLLDYNFYGKRTTACARLPILHVRRCLVPKASNGTAAKSRGMPHVRVGASRTRPATTTPCWRALRSRMPDVRVGHLTGCRLTSARSASRRVWATCAQGRGGNWLFTMPRRESS